MYNFSVYFPTQHQKQVSATQPMKLLPAKNLGSSVVKQLSSSVRQLVAHSEDKDPLHYILEPVSTRTRHRPVNELELVKRDARKRKGVHTQSGVHGEESAPPKAQRTPVPVPIHTSSSTLAPPAKTPVSISVTR